MFSTGSKRLRGFSTDPSMKKPFIFLIVAAAVVGGIVLAASYTTNAMPQLKAQLTYTTSSANTATVRDPHSIAVKVGDIVRLRDEQMNAPDAMYSFEVLVVDREKGIALKKIANEDGTLNFDGYTASETLSITAGNIVPVGPNVPGGSVKWELSIAE